MNRPFPWIWLIALAALNMGPFSHAQDLTAPTLHEVQIKDDFWSKRLNTNRRATIQANLRQCELTGRIRNFSIAAKQEKGSHKGLLYDDSDVYKVLEGIANVLSSSPDSALQQRAEDIIDKIAAAQQSNGYLNTYYTLVRPQDHWKNLQSGHELYCAGHLIEAAVAYNQATGDRKLLDVAIKMAKHIDATFGRGKKADTSGHEEIELALVKLYRATKDDRYLKLAQFFLDTRGRKDKRQSFGEYAQDHKPIREQSEAVGHAVRAMYLYCAMADVGDITDDKGLLTPLTKIWNDIVERRMYITGGIGSSSVNEGFTTPYDLPNDTAYCETCAAVGMALWNHRMFLTSGEARYADVLERVVYNGLLSGVSLSGDRFFYGNPLASAGRHHRSAWFSCACCPPNIARYIPAMGERVWARRGNSIWTVLYIGNTATLRLRDGNVKLTEKTKYPWEGEIEITVEPDRTFTFDVNLRVPGWCHSAPTLTVNGKKMTAAADQGYIRLSRTWNAGDVIRLSLPMPVERVYADSRVKADAGRVALQRGPIVYCLEGVDNSGHVRTVCLPKGAKLSATFDKDLLGGVAFVSGDALDVSKMDKKITTKPVAFKAVPYFAWDNREQGPMIVWIAENPERTGGFN